MNIKQNPFSVYDFLGYFTPGAIFLYSLLFGYAHMSKSANPQEYITNTLGFDKAEIYIPFVLASYTLGHLLSFLSSISVERFSILAHGYPSKYLLKMETDGYFESKGSLFIKLVLLIAILPISVFEYFIGYAFNLRAMYTKPLDRVLRVLISKKINKLVTMHGDIKKPGDFGKPEKTDFFRYAYHYAVEHAPNHLPKMQNYVALYGFLRTLSFISVLIFWVIVWHTFSGSFGSLEASGWLLASSILSYILFMAFMKFYRRFSLEALMALSVSYEG